jgi:putative protease
LESSAQSCPPRRIRSRCEAGLTEPFDAADGPANPALRVLCRSVQQLDAIIACSITSVMVDFADIREYRQAVASARNAGVEIYLATPRIQKPDELGIFHAMAKYNADGWLVRNLAGLE